METLDFADFDKKFELKANEASEDLIAKKEQGKSSTGDEVGGSLTI